MAHGFDGARMRPVSFRVLALLGSAIGSTIFPAAATAQNVSSNGTTDYSLTETGTRSGGPRTIDVTTSGGNIAIDVGTINVANSSGTQGAGIAASNTGPGTVSIKDANVSASGTGVTYGIDARSTTGAITVTNTGTVQSDSNASSRGIYAVSGGGNITVNSNVATGGQRGIFTGSNPAGAETFSTTTLTTITSTDASATAAGSSVNAIIGQGNRVVLTSGTATNSNAAATGGTAIFVNAGTGGALVNAGTTVASGQNQAALQVFSNGAVDVTSGTIRTSQNSDGLSIQSGTDIVVRSTSVTNSGANSGFGIVLGANRGGGGFNGGPDGFAYNSAVVASGSVSTAGAGAYGIYATPNGAGSTTITSNTLTTTGANATGILVAKIGNGVVSGTTTINNTGRLQTGGTAATGIQANSTTGAINIANTGQIVTGGQNAYGINVTSTSGAATITGIGSITTSGVSAHGIYFNPAAGTNTGAISITSGPIAVSGANANGIWVTNAGGAVAINASDVRAIGQAGSAIVVQPTSGATSAVNVAAGIVRATSTGINLSSNGFTGPIIASVADAITGGAAIDARSVGAVSVTGGTVQTTSTNSGSGLIAISSGSTATVNSTNLTAANRGIYARGLDNVTVVSGTLVSTGADFGLIATTSAASNGDPVVGTAEGIVNVTSTNLTATNVGINAYGPRATINVNSGTVTNGSASAIQAFGIDVNVTSGTVNTGGIGIEAGNGTGAPRRGATVINSGTINVNGTVAATTAAITANGASLVINSGTIASTGLGNRLGISAQVPTSTVAGTTLPGTLTITSGSVTTVGDGAYGIQGITDSGALSITNSGTINTVGGTRLAGTQPRYSAGIIATSPAGSITVDSNNISTQGAQADGVRVEAGNGRTNAYNASPNNAAAAISVITRGTTQTAGANSLGIDVLGGGGAVTVNNLGTITTGGAGAYGIGVTPQGGATTIASNAVSTSGAGATGIRAVGSTGAIALTATNTAVTGGAANAIELGTTGGITVNGGTASASTGTAILVNAGGAADVRATRASGGGNGGSGVSVTGTGVTLNVVAASSTGATVTAGGVTSRADAIFAQATTGTINATVGSATAQGANADAVRLIANGTGGAVTLNVTGQVSSAGGYGIFIDPPGAVNVTVASAASVAGAINGLNTVGATNTITNAGSISSSGGAGIVASGATTLDNSGLIVGTGGTAVQLGATNDSVILRTGSGVTGTIQGGGGTDTATLIGSGTAPVSTQTVAALQGFDSLTVQSGYWTAPAVNSSTVGRTTIASGAAFEAQNGAAGIAGYQTGTFTDNGTLVIRSTSASAGNTFGATTVAGTGGVTFTGAGTATLSGNNSLTNTGTNTIDAGSAVLLTGAQAGTFVNNGDFLIGNGGTTGNFTGNLVDNGTLTINRSDAYAFNGALTGAGTIVKSGAGQVVFGTGYAFTGTTVLNGGSIKLSAPVAANTELDVRGTGTIDLSGQTNTVAELQGNSTAATVNIAGGALTVNQSTSTSFAGNLTGAGSFTKSGTGTLNFTGTSTYTGPTTVNGGTLAINGSIASPVTVASGGALGGTGTINGNVTIGSGGTYAPGNSIGTQNVAGNVTFAAGSTYAVEANAAGQSDRIIATGTATISGGNVAVNATAGNYGQLTNYNIITANGGVTGRFAGATSNMAFLSPLLNYTTNAVNLTLARNDVGFASMATNANQTAVATAIAARSLGDPIYNAILFQPTSTAADSFQQLSGEIHATVPAVLVDGGRRVRELVLNRAAIRETGYGIWADGIQTFARSRFQVGFGQARTNRTGVYGGIDLGSGPVRYGVNGGYVDQQVRVPQRASSAKINTKLVGASVAYRMPDSALTLMGGLTHAWHDVDTTRAVSVVGLAGALASSGKANSTEVFGEAAYTMVGGPVTVSPFLRYAHDWTRSDSIAESGASGAALALARDKRSVSFGTAGVRFGGTLPVDAGLALQPKGTLSYEHAWGDLREGRTAAFAGVGPAFTVTGQRIGRDTFAADLGADLVWDSGFRVGASAFMSEAVQWRDYGAKLTVGFRF